MCVLEAMRGEEKEEEKEEQGKGEKKRRVSVQHHNRSTC